MKKNKIRMAFASLSELRLQELCDNILRSMTDNMHFSELTDSTEELSISYQAYKKTIRPKKERSIASATIKEEQKVLLYPVLHKLAYSVMAIAGEDRSILESSGFNLSAEPVKKTIPETPENVRMYLTNDKDAILAVCKVNKNAGVYKVRVSKDQKDWRWGNAGSSCKVFVTGLPIGVLLYVQMAAKNSLGHSTWSEPELVRIPLENEPKMKRKNVNVVS